MSRDWYDLLNTNIESNFTLDYFHRIACWSSRDFEYQMSLMKILITMSKLDNYFKQHALFLIVCLMLTSVKACWYKVSWFFLKVQTKPTHEWVIVPHRILQLYFIWMDMRKHEPLAFVLCISIWKNVCRARYEEEKSL